MLKYLTATLAASAFVLAAAHPGSAQDFPSKPLQIVTDSAGSGNDFAARVLAQGLAKALGLQVIVVNKPSGVVPRETVAKSPADGYTMLLAASAFWIAPLLQKTQYDPVRDFAPISLVALLPNFLVVHPSLPVKSVRDLIALAKARPGELNYSSPSSGSTPHLAAELFKHMAGVNIVRIGYSNASARMVALLSGEIHMEFAIGSQVWQYVKAGKLKALAVTSAKRSPFLPEVPTIAASGVPGYVSVGYEGVLAPAKTPSALIGRLNKEIVRAISQPEINQKFVDTGIETVVSTPEEFAALIDSEMAKWGKVFKDANISAD